jgi:hypothetical protein
MSKQGDRTIKIGGNVTSSGLIAGDSNTVTISADHGLPADQAAVVKQLEFVREQLTSLVSPDARRINNAMDEAIEEAKVAEPRKSIVAESLSRALQIAKGAAGVAEVLKLRPALGVVIEWLGSEFAGLLGMLGL